MTLPAVSLLERLSQARFQFGGTGNRRRLFTVFDEILAETGNGSDEGAILPELRAPERAASFSFTGMTVNNWKAFDQAEFTFPQSGDGRSVILVGGNNGNGKTSILEAVMYGLYGVRGHLDTGRAVRPDAGDVPVAGRRADYQRFMERALHRPAFERGETTISIRISAATGEGPIEIDRQWYFDDEGHFSVGDEELVLRIGDDRHLLQVPEAEDPAEFYQREIGRLLAPASMMPFFLFDGEHVRRLAEQELDGQVRYGIESALGLTTLRSLVDDLRDYARDRERDLSAEDADNSSAAALSKLEAELEEAGRELELIEAELQPLRARRDDMVQEMGSLGVATYDAQKDRLERRKALEAEIKSGRDTLMSAASRLPFALVGTDLLERTVRSLEKTGREADRLSRYDDVMLQRLLAASRDVQPKLTDAEQSLIDQRIGAAWKAMRADATRGSRSSQEKSLHDYLAGLRIDRVTEALRMAATTGQQVKDSLGTLETSKRLLKEMGDAEDTRARTVEIRRALAEELGAVNQAISALELKRRALDQNLGRIQTALAPLRDERLRRRSQRAGSTSLSDRVAAAHSTVASLSRAMEAVVPTYYAQLASKVTEIYRALAHKGIVQRVDIDTSGAVTLLDAAGRNLRNTDPSAGESQIFAMSLISAISDMLGSPLPLIIDTPLGRLDPGHRERILAHFANRPVQTILLSQPEEVGGRYYDLIKSRLLAEFHLTYVPGADGLGRSTLSPGYFPRHAA